MFNSKTAQTLYIYIDDKKQHITLYVEPDLMKFFSKMLSRAGSSSSPTSSISRGRPRDRLSSRWFLKYLWFREVIWEPQKCLITDTALHRVFYQ